MSALIDYRKDIDGLRAIAVVAVVLFHADLGCSGGFVGVDVFFVISGFLITSLILKEIREGRFGLVAFWERRVRRIAPALAVMVIATTVAGWFLYFPEDYGRLAQSVVAQVFLVSNMFFWRQAGYFSPEAETKPLLHTWSLAVEEQFYIFFPLLLVFLFRKKRGTGGGAVLWLALASFGLGWWGVHVRPMAAFYLLPTRAWELLIGALIAGSSVRGFAARWQGELAAWTGLALILGSVLLYTRATLFPGLAALAPCVGAGLIIFSGAAPAPTAVGRMLAVRPMQFIGQVSYSFYLWHWPVLMFAKYTTVREFSVIERLGLAAVSFGLAVISWRWIETPFRKRSFCPQRWQVFAFAGLSSVAMLAIGGAVYLAHGFPARMPAGAADFMDSPGSGLKYTDITLKEAEAGEFVELGGQARDQPIKLLLWGDSHAMSAAIAVDALCRKYAVRAVRATHSSTAPVLNYVSHVNSYSMREQSIGFAQAVVDFTIKNNVPAVIMIGAWATYSPADVVEARMRDTIKLLKEHGVTVYVLRDFPRPGFDTPRAAALMALHGDNLERLEGTAADYLNYNRDYEPIFARLSDTGAVVVDTRKYFLKDNGRYAFFKDGKVLYFDHEHLTVAGAKLLEPVLEPFIRQLN